MNLFYAERPTFHKHIELTNKVITQVFADQSRSEIMMYRMAKYNPYLSNRPLFL